MAYSQGLGNFTYCIVIIVGTGRKARQRPCNSLEKDRPWSQTWISTPAPHSHPHPAVSLLASYSTFLFLRFQVHELSVITPTSAGKKWDCDCKVDCMVLATKCSINNGWSVTRGLLWLKLMQFLIPSLNSQHSFLLHHFLLSYNLVLIWDKTRIRNPPWRRKICSTHWTDSIFI